MNESVEELLTKEALEQSKQEILQAIDRREVQLQASLSEIPALLQKVKVPPPRTSLLGATINQLLSLFRRR